MRKFFMRITVPTVLTCIRIVLVPFIAYSIALHDWFIAIVLFLIAAITDALDGFLARRWDQETKLGAYLDPLADKLLITACYAALVFAPIEGLIVPTWFLAVVFAKEMILLLGAFYFGIVKQSVAIKPNFLGKLAMVVQSSFVAWLIACSIFHWIPTRTFYVFLGVALGLVIVSLVHYGLSATSKITQ